VRDSWISAIWFDLFGKFADDILTFSSEIARKIKKAGRSGFLATVIRRIQRIEFDELNFYSALVSFIRGQSLICVLFFGNY